MNANKGKDYKQKVLCIIALQMLNNKSWGKSVHYTQVNTVSYNRELQKLKCYNFKAGVHVNLSEILVSLKRG